MKKRVLLYALLIMAVCAVLLSGCDSVTSVSSTVTEDSAYSSSTTLVSGAEEWSTDISATTTTATTIRETVDTATTTQSTSTATSASVAKVTSTTTTTVPTTTTTAQLSTTTTADPNRATVNGKEYAVGDSFDYTVMVKTGENYGRVKIAVRYVQKGLEIPNGLPMKQQQAVLNNMGMGMLVGPEESAKQNGFTVTSNKGFSLDSSISGYAGLVRFYETTNYDSNSQAYRPIDCSGGVTLYTVTLKITKPGDYLVDCFEYPAKTRTDITVWGKMATKK